MGLFNFFKNKPKTNSSANIAKERLQIIVSHQRNESHSGNKKPDFINRLQDDILEVVKKYVNIGHNDIKIDIDSQGDRSVLELNVTIPEESSQPKQVLNA
ncbi:cell division topological specificity factor MinE [Cysteiniphilum halobium]|uniref:cell division topological specificity factor MinE n=1 Tax=Cysteiniphilum halobium TaxID=2219059 RepID=UPI000E65AACC|nr:cell division topological specificity factor MinE [Cysteiniphilum halobium]